MLVFYRMKQEMDGDLPRGVARPMPLYMDADQVVCVGKQNESALIAMDSLPPAREIPGAFSQSIRSWWHAGQKQSAISEQRLLLRTLPYLGAEPSTDFPVVARSSLVQLDTPKRYLNTLSITPTATPSSPPPSPAILLHGYGAGLAFFFRNFPPLAKWVEKRGSSVYALDWLGMGRSARVPFHIRAKRQDVDGRVIEAESFFIDSLEEWRKKMGLSQMTLIGHSLGAYFSVAYALRYPDRVTKLILLSPAGVPNYDEPSTELTDEGHDNLQSPSRPKLRELSSLERATTINMDSIRQEQKKAKVKARESNIRRLFTYLWEEGWSPLQIVRSTFFWSPMLIGKVRTSSFFVTTLLTSPPLPSSSIHLADFPLSHQKKNVICTNTL